MYMYYNAQPILYMGIVSPYHSLYIYHLKFPLCISLLKNFLVFFSLVVYLREIIFVITCSCFPFHFKLFIASTKGEKQTWKCCVSSLERMHWIKMPFVNYLYSSCLWSVSILDKVQQGNIYVICLIQNGNY